MPSVYIKTYGCQMNERDSEAVAAQLVAKGYLLAQSEANADVVLLSKDLEVRSVVAKGRLLMKAGRPLTKGRFE